MSTETAQSLGYEAPVKSSGVYLRLDTKGASARIRIASRPYRFVETVTSPERGTKEVNRWAWIVLHKELIDGKVTRSVKAFKAGPMIYALVYEYVAAEDWGDPTHYDLTITRTEEKGRYYTVTAHPKPIGPLSAEELALVAEADLDLCQLYTANGAEQVENPDDEGDPFADDPALNADVQAAREAVAARKTAEAIAR